MNSTLASLVKEAEPLLHLTYLGNGKSWCGVSSREPGNWPTTGLKWRFEAIFQAHCLQDESWGSGAAGQQQCGTQY